MRILENMVGGVLFYKQPDGEIVGLSLGSVEVKSLVEWARTQDFESLLLLLPTKKD